MTAPRHTSGYVLSRHQETCLMRALAYLSSVDPYAYDAPEFGAGTEATLQSMLDDFREREEQRSAK
jgi:hypothetical protein